MINLLQVKKCIKEKTYMGTIPDKVEFSNWNRKDYNKYEFKFYLFDLRTISSKLRKT